MLSLLNSFASVMSTIGYVILAIIMFAILICIHELGHYTAGKIFKFKINEFSIGFGKALYSKKRKNGELFSIRIVPLGGYCAFEGEEGGSDVEGAFNKQAWWKRWIVLFAGVFFNFVSAVIVAVPLLMACGNAIPRIFDFVDGCPNHIEYNMETLQQGDVIVGVNGVKPTYLNGGISGLTQAQADTPYTLTISRDGATIEINVTNMKLTDVNGDEYYGIGMNVEMVKYSFFQALGMSIPFCFEIAGECLRIVWLLITGRFELRLLGGPITAISQVANAASISLLYLLLFFPVIAINLAVFNFLPLPALDGGRSVFVLIEAIRGKPIKPEIENKIHSIGLLLLFGFVIVIDFLQVFVW